MSDVKRYEPVAASMASAFMEEAEGGGWVDYDDFKALESRLSSVHSELAKYIDLALPKAKPSCLVCGRSDYDKPAIQHMELGSIVVCEPCSSASRRLGAYRTRSLRCTKCGEHYLTVE